MTEALIKESQDLKYPDDMIDEMRAFLKNKDAASFDAISKNQGNIEDILQIQLSEKFVNLANELIRYFEVTNMGEAEINTIRIALRRLKRFAIKVNGEDVNLSQYLSQKFCKELQIFAIEDLDVKNLYSEGVDIVKQIMENPNPSSFDSVRVLNTIILMAIKCGERVFELIGNYRNSGIFFGINNSFDFLIAANFSNSVPTVSSPEYEQLLKANTPEEWISTLDQVFLLEDSQKFLDYYHHVLFCLGQFDYFEGLLRVGSPQPTFSVVEAANSLHSHNQYLKKNNPSAYRLVEALIKNENVVGSAAIAKDELSLLKPFTGYLFARDRVLNAKTGFENWLMLNTSLSLIVKIIIIDIK